MEESSEHFSRATVAVEKHANAPRSWERVKSWTLGPLQSISRPNIRHTLLFRFTRQGRFNFRINTNFRYRNSRRLTRSWRGFPSPTRFQNRTPHSRVESLEKRLGKSLLKLWGVRPSQIFAWSERFSLTPSPSFGLLNFSYRPPLSSRIYSRSKWTSRNQIWR